VSLIFDALQRSETERSGANRPTLAPVTEVLRLVELRVAEERKSATPVTDELISDLTAGSTTANGVPTRSKLASPSLPPAFPPFETLACEPDEAKLVSLSYDNTLVAEKFRFLGVTLRHAKQERQLKKVLITSTIPQEGKSVIAANLACSLSRTTQEKVLLIEGDLRRPALSSLLGTGARSGLCEYLQEQKPITESIYRLGKPGIWFMPAGSFPANPLELLQSSRMSAAMDLFSSWFDWVILDSPPVMPLADTSILARLSDGVLLVVRQGVTEKRQLERGMEAIDSNKILGAVMNGSRRKTASDSYYAAP
jgi:capsular exopolysaccharide synthesis family protein